MGGSTRGTELGKQALIAGVHDWTSLGKDAVKACSLYRVELRTQLTLDAEDAGRIRGTIAATATDAPERVLAELMGYSEQGKSFAFDEPSYRLELPHSSDNCVYEDRSELAAIRGQFLQIAHFLPERRIPGLSYGDANESGGGGGSEEDPVGRLVIDSLEGTGSIQVHCGDRTFPVPLMSTLVPMWFSGAHHSDYYEGLEFLLKEETRGILVASFASDNPIVDPSDPTAKVTQDTEVEVFHTPQSMGREEPARPPDRFP